MPLKCRSDVLTSESGVGKKASGRNPDRSFHPRHQNGSGERRGWNFRYINIIIINNYIYINWSAGGCNLPGTVCFSEARGAELLCRVRPSSVTKPHFCHYFSPKSSPFCAVFGLEGGARSFVLVLSGQLLFLCVVLSQN